MTSERDGTMKRIIETYMSSNMGEDWNCSFKRNCVSPHFGFYYENEVYMMHYLFERLHLDLVEKRRNETNSKVRSIYASVIHIVFNLNSRLSEYAHNIYGFEIPMPNTVPERVSFDQLEESSRPRIIAFVEGYKKWLSENSPIERVPCYFPYEMQ